MTSIQRRFLIDECLAPTLIQSYLKPHVEVTEDAVEFTYFKDKFGPNSTWKDRDFVPELAKDGRWVILSSDLSKNGPRLDSMRIACRTHKQTLICLSSAIYQSKLEGYGPQFTMHWANIMQAAAGPRGGQYQIRSHGQTTILVPIECPDGSRREGSFCVADTPIYDGEPQSLSRKHLRRSKSNATGGVVGQ